MAISRVTSGNAAAGSLTFNTGYAVNDIIIILAINTGGSTTPTLPTGYTLLSSAADSTNGWAMSSFWKLATSTSETPPSPTNTTAMAYAIYHGINTTTPISNAAGQAGTTSSISYSGITTMTQSGGAGTSWVLTFGTAKGITGNVGSSPPTAQTLVTEYKVTTPDAAIFDSNAAVSTYSFNSKTLAAAVPWLTKTAELNAAATGGGTPTNLFFFG